MYNMSEAQPLFMAVVFMLKEIRLLRLPTLLLLGN